jgi:hypothetical protein
LTLPLILQVTTLNVESAFLTMNIVKIHLRNQIGDQWMNDCLATYVENDIFKTIINEKIMQQFQRMKAGRGQLYKVTLDMTK